MPVLGPWVWGRTQTQLAPNPDDNDDDDDDDDGGGGNGDAGIPRESNRVESTHKINPTALIIMKRKLL